MIVITINLKGLLKSAKYLIFGNNKVAIYILNYTINV